MGGLLKERARKPVIPTGVGIALPAFKYIDGEKFYVLEVREPWRREGYAIYSVLMTEREMLGAVASWTGDLAEDFAKKKFVTPTERDHG